MKTSVKAALLSAAILPGAGFFLLRQYLSGLLFLVPSLASLLYILRHFYQKTQALADQILLGEIPPDISFMMAKIFSETDPEKIRLLSLAAWIFAASWLLSTLASAIAGHLHDKKLTPPPSFR